MLKINMQAQLNSRPILEGSTSFIENLEETLLRNLSADSVSYLIACAEESDSEEIKTYLSEKYKAWKNRNTTTPSYICSLPMFWSYDVLLERIKKNKTPLIFKIKHSHSFEVTNLFFKIESTASEYVNTSPNDLDCDSAALVVEGVTRGNVEEIKKFSPIEIILANAAVHKQYVDQDNDQKYLAFDVNTWVSKKEKGEDHLLGALPDNRWGEFIKKGLTLGCTKTNPNLFLIHHVFCTTVKKQFPSYTAPTLVY